MWRRARAWPRWSCRRGPAAGTGPTSPGSRPTRRKGRGRPHPRAYGTFPRKIRYALDEHVVTLEQAIRSATGLPAQILSLPDRGILRPGAFADLLIFDPARFRDAATFDEPTRYAPGI